MPSAPILFLDIDGVLIAYPEGEHTPPSFTRRCVEAFRTILESMPELRIVFCSTWRWPLHVTRLHQQWLANGLPAEVTIDGTPDMRTDPNAPRFSLRGWEIKTWLEQHPDTTRWAVLDDERMSIEGVLPSGNCVFTNPQRGLEFRDAERIIQILKEKSLTTL